MAVKFDTGIIFRKGNTAKLDLVTHKIDFIDGDNYDYRVYNFLSGISGDDMFSIYDSVFGISALRGTRGDTAHTHTSLCTLTDGTAFSFDGEKLFRISRGSYVVENIRY